MMQNGEKSNKKLYSDYIRDIFNLGQMEKLPQYLHPDWRLKTAAPGDKADRSAVASLVHMFRSGFRDFQITLNQMVSEKEWLTCRSTFTGTHTGLFLGQEASGKQVSMTSFTMIRICSGKISESWVFNDMEALKRQISQPASRHQGAN